MTSRNPALLLPLGVALAGLLAWTITPAGASRADRGAMSAAAPSSFIVATIDVDAIRNAPFKNVIFGFAGTLSKAFGWSELADPCGLDVSDRVNEVVVLVPEGGGKGDFGIAATGTFSDAEIRACAEKIAALRGGGGRASEIGSFGVLETEGAIGVQGSSETRLAYRKGGPLLLARGDWLRTMIESSDRKSPGLPGDSPHSLLRRKLAPTAGKKTLLVATAILPATLRARIKEEMAAELGPGDGNRAMVGVLGVEAVGVSIEQSATEVGLRIELMCEAGASCQEVEKLLLRERLRLSQNLFLRVLGFGPLLDSVATKTDERTLTGGARARTDDVATAIDRVLELLAQRQPPPGLDRTPQNPVNDRPFPPRAAPSAPPSR